MSSLSRRDRLLEFVLSDHRFSMPVGRIEYLHLGPLRFSEFLNALGEDYLAALLTDWQHGAPFATSAHERLVKLQRDFTVVGGLPEAVWQWQQDRSLESVADVHRSIVATYRDDFAKYTTNHQALLRLQRVFDHVPRAIGNKVKYSNIDRDSRARQLRTVIDMLAHARVIWRVHHSACAGVPLGGQLNPDVYKILFLDVGLATHALGLRWNDLSRHQARQWVNEGGLAEQFVGQHLLFRDGGHDTPTLVYWLREGRRDNAEVDYVIASGAMVIPVEVKAGSTGSLKSLHRFLSRDIKGGDTLPIAVRFDLSLPSLGEFHHKLTNGTAVNYRLLSLPLYMVEQVDRLLDEASLS